MMSGPQAAASTSAREDRPASAREDTDLTSAREDTDLTSARKDTDPMTLTQPYLRKSVSFYSTIQLLLESTVCLFNILNLNGKKVSF